MIHARRRWGTHTPPGWSGALGKSFEVCRFHLKTAAHTDPAGLCWAALLPGHCSTFSLSLDVGAAGAGLVQKRVICCQRRGVPLGKGKTLNVYKSWTAGCCCNLQISENSAHIWRLTRLHRAQTVWESERAPLALPESDLMDALPTIQQQLRDALMQIWTKTAEKGFQEKWNLCHSE